MFLFFSFGDSRAFSQTATNALPALSPAYGELPPTFLERSELTPAYWSQPCTVIMVGGIVGIVLAAVTGILFMPIQTTVRPSEADARSALAKLTHQPEDGKLLSEVSQILRRYVAAAFELPSGEMTTVEFSAAIAGNEKIGAELAQTISSFLRECDERKFSPVNSSAPLNAATRALELISLAEKVRDRRDACPTTK